ncbi:MAG TPA: transketolase C-terminal domain-containing protein, partial [Rectinemataceae bacterium]
MSAPGFSCRHAFSSTLLEMARSRSELWAVCSDSRGSAAMEGFAEALPERFVEAGIAEQDAVGIAAGIASFGNTVFVCGPACFYSARSLEQVKVDVAYSRADVKVVGISGGLSYGPLGSTHHSLHDLAVMRAIPGIEVFVPCDTASTKAVTEYLASSGKPAYLRLGRAPVADVYCEAFPSPFVPGKALTLREGGDCSIIAAGECVQPALEAADILAKSGIRARVLDFCSIKPLDEGAIAAAASQTGCILTVEEHSIHGGLGAAVAEIVVQTRPVPMRILGVPDEWAPCGSSAELFRHYGLTGPA